jgi:serine/threonine protein kinase
MTLTKGATLGAYEILSPLEPGLMGKVYRAEETNLNRQVALSVLADIFSSSRPFTIGYIGHNSEPRVNHDNCMASRKVSQK